MSVAQHENDGNPKGLKRPQTCVFVCEMMLGGGGGGGRGRVCREGVRKLQLFESQLTPPHARIAE